jgi:hypothetical protein
MEMKRCCSCQETKPFSGFRNNASKKDGKAGECRDCERVRKREQRKNWTPEQKSHYRSLPSVKRAKANYRKTEQYKLAARPGERRRRQHKYRADPEYRAKVIAKLKAAKTPEKNRARRALGRALTKGKIQKQPCACGNTRAHGHHEDYSKPLEVTWLCASCHSKLHHQKRLLDLDSY